jgi:hypothetical protein
VTIADIPAGGCAVHADAWSGAVSFRAGGPSFAHVTGAAAYVTLGAPPTAHVSVEASIRLHAIVQSPEVYLAKPTILGRFAVPLAGTKVAWDASRTPGKIAVEIPTTDDFTEPAKVGEELDCASVVVVEPTYDARAFIDAKRGVEVTVKGSAPFNEAPGGPVVGQLKPEIEPQAFVIGTQGTWRKIALEGSGYWAFGWVEAKFVGTAGVGYIGSIGQGPGEYGEYIGPPPSCDHDLPMFGQVAGERAHIGTLRAQSGYRLDQPQPAGLEPGWASLHLIGHWLWLEDGAMLLVRREDLGRCE